ncbi:hypothetical protein RDWZM_006052 [Blomia tropicalis]|uniref:Uncharacterized protein n=1 Tax=Blomia tropicalis TaxID=40697 RepID=A0A9Q0RN69_BLOTA|nr:hypothetical protein RDWZM_006052 [Blomia tropicalis]
MFRLFVILLIAIPICNGNQQTVDNDLIEHCFYALKKLNLFAPENRSMLDKKCTMAHPSSAEKAKALKTFKSLEKTDLNDRLNIIGCLIDDEIAHSNDQCQKWSLSHDISKETLSRREMWNIQFADFVKKTIIEGEKCLFKLVDQKSDDCKLLNGLRKRRSYSDAIKKRIFKKLSERDIQDQVHTDHCFWYHQQDGYIKCVGISMATHITGYTMSSLRQTRIRNLWRSYQKNMMLCVPEFDKSSCMAQFDPKQLCDQGPEDECAEPMWCKYSDDWHSDPTNICHLIVAGNLTERFISQKFENMKINFIKLEKLSHKEDCEKYHEHDGFCKK